MTDPEIYEALGRLVRSHRERLGRTQADVALVAGLSRASIANIEKGRQRILLHDLYSLAQALGVEAATLLPDLPASGLNSARPKIKAAFDLSDGEQADIARVVGKVERGA